MSSSVFRRNLILISLGILALGAVGLAGLWHPAAPDAAMQNFLPAVTLPTVVVAGIVDGFNPCAFTVLLLFVTALLTTLKAGETNINQQSARLFVMGSIYFGAVFLTYLILGVGLLKASDFFTREHLPARIGALVAILFGLWTAKDYFLPDWGWRLQAPARIGAIVRQAAQKAMIPALIVGGFLIGLCTPL